MGKKSGLPVQCSAADLLDSGAERQAGVIADELSRAWREAGGPGGLEQGRLINPVEMGKGGVGEIREDFLEEVIVRPHSGYPTETGRAFQAKGSA